MFIKFKARNLVSSIPSFRLLGLAFLFAGFYCHNFTEGFFPVFSSGEIVIGFPTIVSYGFLAASLFLTPFFSRLYGRLIDHKALAFIAAALVAIGSIFSYLTQTTGGSNLFMLLGALLVAIGSSWLWIMWGELYASFEPDEVNNRFSLSLVLMYLTFFLILALPPHFSTVLMILLPLLSGSLLILCLQNLETADADTNQETPGKDGATYREVRHENLKRSIDWSYYSDLLRTGLSFFCISISVAFMWTFVNIVEIEITKAFFAVAFGGGALVAIILAFVNIEYSRKIDLFALGQYVFPALTLAAVLIYLFPDGTSTIGFALVCAANVFVDFLGWVIFSQKAHDNGEYTTRTVGWGRFSVHFGFFCGALLGRSLNGFYSSGSMTPAEALCVAVLLITVASVITLTIQRKNVFTTVDELKSASDFDHLISLSNVDHVSFGTAYGLTDRELQILQLIDAGYSVSRIQQTLFISKNTVNTHVRHIYKKIGVHSRDELHTLLSKGAN